MKNNFIKIISLFFFLLFLSKAYGVEQFNFDVTEVEILQDGNKFIGTKRGTITTDDNIIIDVVPGRGGMFSLEGPTGKRFLTRSKVFSDDEYKEIKSNPPLSASEVSGIDGLKTTS